MQKMKKGIGNQRHRGTIPVVLWKKNKAITPIAERFLTQPKGSFLPIVNKPK